MDKIEAKPGCISRAMEIVGNKWTALILRDLAMGSKRFSELQRSIDINPRTLSQRLDGLAAQGIIEPVNPGNTAYKAYRLTHKGTDLLPILQAMAEWGDKYPSTPSNLA